MKRWGNRVNKTATKGFTIVELIIVIVVIAILSVIIIVSYNAVVSNAHNSAVQADLSKLADAIKLKTLDDGIVPDGGATSLNTGNSTVLPGISFAPNKESYDRTVANLYYCAGDINGTKEYAIIAKSLSGVSYILRSNQGLADLTEYLMTSSNNGVALCTAVGFTAPFTWSYGYASTTNTWWTWANASS